MHRRHLLQLAASSALMPHALASSSPARFLYVGSYAPLGRGIYSFAIGAGGDLQPVGVAANAGSPSWLLAHEGRVYAAEESADQIAVYTPDDAGALQLLHRQPSGGQGPVHLSVSTGQLWVAHYGDARFAALPVKPDGRLGSAVSWRSCDGDCRPGPTQPLKAPPGSQASSGHDAPHAHMLQPSPDGRWLLGTDLGRDRLLVWPLSDLRQPPRELALSSGSGPRHFVFQPGDAGLVHVLQEESSTLSTVMLAPLQVVNEVSVLPAGFEGTNYASDLLVAPGGRHLYALNRLHDSIAVLSLGEPSSPKLLDHHWVRGSYPRNAWVAGEQMYVCNQRSDQLSHFDVSRPEAPRFTGRQTGVPSPAGACAL